MTKRSDETQLLPRPKIDEQSSAPANDPEEELELIRSDAAMNGKRAAQEWIKGRTAGCHHKLARLGRGGDQGSRKGQPIQGPGQLLDRLNNGIFLVLGHRKRYNKLQVKKRSSL